MKPYRQITADELFLLKSLLAYDPATGVFTWKHNRKAGVVSGDVAGTSGAGGYIRLKVNQQQWSANRVAWAFTHGAQHFTEIDHINGIRTDNRIINLRLVTRKENSRNRTSPRKGSGSGYLGVRFDKRRKKNPFYAGVIRDGLYKYLGSFSNPLDAHAAYVSFRCMEDPGADIHIARGHVLQPLRQRTKTTDPRST